MKRIAIIGELNPDLIMTGAPSMPVPGREIVASGMDLVLGASSAICAAQFVRLGNEVVYLSVVGDDAFGRLCLDWLAALGVATDGVIVDPALRTGLTISIVSGGDRAMLTHLGCISEMSYERVDFGRLRGCDHLHVGGFFLQGNLQPACARIFAQAKAMGMTTSLDVGWDVNERWDGGLGDALAHTDVFLPNESEAQHVARRESVEEAAQARKSVV